MTTPLKIVASIFFFSNKKAQLWMDKNQYKIHGDRHYAILFIVQLLSNEWDNEIEILPEEE